jgi:hypothetical protein
MSLDAFVAAATGVAQARRPRTPSAVQSSCKDASSVACRRQHHVDYLCLRSPVLEVATPQLVSSPGFDWGDAGIGAGVALGLVLLGGAAFGATRQLGKAQTA